MLRIAGQTAGPIVYTHGWPGAKQNSNFFFSLATPNPSSCVNITALKWIKMKIKCQHVIPIFHLNSHFSDIFRSELMSFIRNQRTSLIHTVRVSNRQNLTDLKCYGFFMKKYSVLFIVISFYGFLEITVNYNNGVECSPF